MKVFDKPGREPTDETCRIAVERAIEMQHAPIVSPTTVGASALRLCEIAKEMGYTGQIVIVTPAYGASQKAPGQNSLTDEKRDEIHSHGAITVTAAHILSGVERGMSTKFQGVYPAELIAHSLRMLSQGMKVTVEIGCMALDAGAIAHGVEIVCLGGTGGGLDTAVVMSPAHANNIFATNIHEVLCMPH